MKVTRTQVVGATVATVALLSRTIVLAIVAVQSVGSGTRCTRTRSRRHVGSIVRKEERMPSKRLLTVWAGVVTAVVLAGCGSSSSGGTPSAGGSTTSTSESTSPGTPSAGGSTPSTSESTSPGTPSAGGSTPSTSESTSPGPAGGKTRTSPLSASPFPAGGDLDGATLKAGRYVTSDPFPVPVSVTVPAGWMSEELDIVTFLSTADGEGNDGPAVLTLLLPSTDLPIEFSDPCNAKDPGTSVASLTDFVKAVTAMRGTKVTGPTDVTLGGLKGRKVTLTAPRNGCKGSGVVMTLYAGHEFVVFPGQSMSLTALDDNGVVLIVEEKTTSAATPKDRAQLAKVLKSMSIGKST
jgi:hypothetical protein